MAKCHKGNTRHRCKKREKYVNDFYAREQELNRLINNFIKDYKHLNPSSISEYKKMDKNRLEIKRLLLLQSGELWKQSHRRKRFYHKQLNKFKYFYVAWKHKTYYIYLHVRFDMPLCFIQPLMYYKKVSHNISHTIFTL